MDRSVRLPSQKDKQVTASGWPWVAAQTETDEGADTTSVCPQEPDGHRQTRRRPPAFPACPRRQASGSPRGTVSRSPSDQLRTTPGSPNLCLPLLCSPRSPTKSPAVSTSPSPSVPRQARCWVSAHGAAGPAARPWPRAWMAWAGQAGERGDWAASPGSAHEPGGWTEAVCAAWLWVSHRTLPGRTCTALQTQAKPSMLPFQPAPPRSASKSQVRGLQPSCEVLPRDTAASGGGRAAGVPGA